MMREHWEREPRKVSWEMTLESEASLPGPASITGEGLSEQRHNSSNRVQQTIYSSVSLDEAQPELIHGSEARYKPSLRHNFISAFITLPPYI